MKNQIIVSLAIILDPQKGFLLSQRNSPEYPEVHKKWQLVGGGVEFGEDPKDALIRELSEELQVSPTFLSEYTIVKSNNWHHTNEKTSQVILIGYLVNIGEQKIDFSNDPETADAKWFSLKEIIALDTLPQTKEFIKESLQIIEKQ